MKIQTPFSVLNESDLHKSLKTIYCQMYEGKTEVTLEGHIYDIVTKNGNVIEIQTGNLSKLHSKIIDILKNQRKIKILYPLVIERKIKLFSQENTVISNRKSPKKVTIYEIFRELTKLYDILLNPNFSLEILFVKITEERVRTDENVQSKNNQRRYKKNWNKTNKILEQIFDSKIFNSKDDYLNVFLQDLPELFCAKDLFNKIIKNEPKINPNYAMTSARYTIWVLSKMGIISFSKKNGNTKLYFITSE